MEKYEGKLQQLLLSNWHLGHIGNLREQCKESSPVEVTNTSIGT